MLDIILSNWATHVYLVYLVVLVLLFVVHRKRANGSVHGPQQPAARRWKRPVSPWAASWQSDQQRVR
jgi:hypothetical protein